MSTRMIIELDDASGVRTVVDALEAYKTRLQAGIDRTSRRLAAFEARYGVPTARFLAEMTAEDLQGGDIEYVEWAGEAGILEALEREQQKLTHARYQLP